MATTAVLDITHIETGQVQKEITSNEAFDDLANHIAGQFVYNISADSDYTLNTQEGVEQQRNFNITVTDTSALLTANRNLIVPSSNNRWMVTNNTTFTITVKTLTGEGVTVVPGQNKLIYCDGTDCFAEGNAIDLVFYFPGKPTENATALAIPIVQNMSFPASLVVSRVHAGIVPTSTKNFKLTINASVFASVVISAGASAAYFETGVSATVFVPGDIFSVETPVNQDATLQNIGFTLRAYEE